MNDNANAHQRPYIVLPPSGRHRWLPSGRQEMLDLLYLSWGFRQYGLHPIAESHLAGWNYVAVLKGSPLLLVAGRPLRLQAGCLVILPARTLTAWSDDGSAKCEVLTWLWRSPPFLNILAENRYLPYRTQLFDLTREKLRKIHRRTRALVAAPDRWTFHLLQEMRLNLEITIAKNEPRSVPDSRLRYQLAMNYLLQHPEIHDSVSALSDYLQISTSSIRRLFMQYGRKSAGKVSLEIRLKKARQMLQEKQASVKKCAYSLGYRHPNDLSRAYRNFFGTTPTNV